MLVLTRKRGQEIKISDDIVITLVEIRGDRVKLGIQAPAEVKILRSELLEDPESEVSVQPS